MKGKKLKLETAEAVYIHTQGLLKNEKKQSGITLIALIVTILFSYDEK